MGNGEPSCCHCSIRRPRPVSGDVRLRAPPGGMSARSRAGSRCSGERGACMKPDFLFCFIRGLVCAAHSRLTGYKQHVTGIHGNQWIFYTQDTRCGISRHPKPRHSSEKSQIIYHNLTIRKLSAPHIVSPSASDFPATQPEKTSKPTPK